MLSSPILEITDLTTQDTHTDDARADRDACADDAGDEGCGKVEHPKIYKVIMSHFHLLRDRSMLAELADSWEFWEEEGTELWMLVQKLNRKFDRDHRETKRKSSAKRAETKQRRASKAGTTYYFLLFFVHCCSRIHAWHIHSARQLTRFRRHSQFPTCDRRHTRRIHSAPQLTRFTVTPESQRANADTHGTSPAISVGCRPADSLRVNAGALRVFSSVPVPPTVPNSSTCRPVPESLHTNANTYCRLTALLKNARNMTVENATNASRARTIMPHNGPPLFSKSVTELSEEGVVMLSPCVMYASPWTTALNALDLPNR
ncbi:hypothetical protein EW146_g9117 [Bondarzewia mesenterica]|uniref:Uncharacterized protein n=1 Tax=Bondarzewia mesenterica TaxID=1095465 RepID=A0A4S4LAF3_9AGAM|nr:hypothetical protein EW146_g9117 [Bondarzewia mesenterica]